MAAQKTTHNVNLTDRHAKTPDHPSASTSVITTREHPAPAAGREVDTPQLAEAGIVNLCIQEYIALRSEQRVRLESANKIINYYAIVIAAVIGGLLSLGKALEVETFRWFFQNVLLLIPIITMPFAFTQQNEEIFVRHIGAYLEQLKAQISAAGDSRYWLWETYHSSKAPPRLKFTGMFRAGLLIIFSGLSLVLRIMDSPRPRSIAHFVQSNTWPQNTVFVIDVILILIASAIGIRMAIRAQKKALEPTTEGKIFDLT